MRGSDITTEDLYEMFRSFPQEKRRWARWVMSKQDRDDLSRRIPPLDGSRYFTHLFGKPVDLREDADGISIVEDEPLSLLPDPLPPDVPEWLPYLLNEIRRRLAEDHRCCMCTHEMHGAPALADEPPPFLRGWVACSECEGVPTGYGPGCPNCTRPLVVRTDEAGLSAGSALAPSRTVSGEGD